MINRVLASMTLATVSVASLTVATSPAVAQPAGFRTQADALLERAYPADGPGAAAVVMRKGEVIYAAGRGLADLQTRRPITPDTLFKLGSIAKQFTAATVLQLVAEGRISLDDPLSRFFPDWPQPSARATVRQLLNHSSGIQDYTKIPGFMGSAPTLRPNTTADLLTAIRSRPAVSAPGTRWEYNNGGYVVLGAIVEKVTGQAWHDAVIERIGRPLGLRTLAYAVAADGAPDAARGYSRREGAYQPAQGVHMSVAHAAGGLVASVADMAKWAKALHRGRVFSPALYAEMTRPARLADGSTEPYGFGFRLQQVRGRAAFVHGGAGRGLDTDSVYVPADDLFVAVFANSDDPQTDPSTLTRRLAALALDEPIPSFTRAKVDIASLAPLFGSYTAPDGPPRRFFARDGKLYMARGDGELEVFAAGQDRFFFGPDELNWFRLTRKPDGAHVLEMHRAEARTAELGRRTGPVPPALVVPPAVLRSYVGAYATEGPVLTVALDAGGQLTLQPPDGPPLPMRPVSETEFRVDQARSRVVFHPEDGRVDRLTVHRGARQLNGKRTGR